MITIHPQAEKMRMESNFQIFKHEGLYCVIKRMASGGNINGYVAVSDTHPFYGKTYHDKIKLESEPKFNGNYIDGEYSLDMTINVHGGLTYSDNHLAGIENGLLGELWWFGFDTAHAGDITPFEDEISRKYRIADDEYRDWDYVEQQVKKLAEQLKVLSNQN